MPIEILAYEDTELGTLCLRRRELLSNPGTQVTEVTLNHEFLMSSYLTESERSLSRIGLEMVKQNDAVESVSVLVGGLGLGYTAAELLDSDRVGQVEVIDFLPQVIGWLRDGLIPLSEQLNSSKRLTVTRDDIYARLGKEVPSESDNENRFDLIVIDVDHSPEDVLGEQSNNFYSIEGLARASQHLVDEGVLGVWSYAESTPLLTNMKEVFTDVRVEGITVWNDLIDVEQTDWLFFGRRR